jgi:hypothetical protein
MTSALPSKVELLDGRNVVSAPLEHGEHRPQSRDHGVHLFEDLRKFSPHVFGRVSMESSQKARRRTVPGEARSHGIQGHLEWRGGDGQLGHGLGRQGEDARQHGMEQRLLAAHVGLHRSRRQSGLGSDVGHACPLVAHGAQELASGLDDLTEPIGWISSSHDLSLD